MKRKNNKDFNVGKQPYKYIDLTLDGSRTTYRIEAQKVAHDFAMNGSSIAWDSNVGYQYKYDTIIRDEDHLRLWLEHEMVWYEVLGFVSTTELRHSVVASMEFFN